MPNRIIRSGILTSEKINRLSLESEVFYRRLLSVVDDYGRCEANPALLRASLYPLRIDRVKESAVRRMLAEVVDNDLVILYEVGGKSYLEVINFGQQRRTDSKCPAPAAQMIADDTHVPANDAPMIADAKQMIANAHLGVVEGVVGDEGVVGGRRKRPQPDKPDSLETVKAYAATIGLSAEQAEIFHDHFEANGWRQGGRTPIKDWRAACRNWRRRADQFSSPGSTAGAKGHRPKISNEACAPLPGMTEEQLKQAGL